MKPRVSQLRLLWPFASSSRIALVATALWLSCLAVSSFAATYGYAPIPLAWIDNTAHTDVTWGGAAQCAAWNFAPVDDDGTAPINLGFTFTFGGTAYTQVRIISNGRLQFGNNYCGYGTQTVGPPPTYPYNYPDANMNNTMRVYGADFCPAGGGTGCAGRVTYAMIGSAPNRQFVVTWSQMKEWNSGSSLFNVQMILQENGDFIYQYKDIANVSQGVGQVGYQLTASDYVVVDTTTINSLAYSGLRFFKPTPPLAEYRFDECAGAPTQATDSSGNGYHGTLVGGMSVASTGRLCTADSFDGNTGYIGLPASFPKLGSAPGYTSFTVASWINSSNAAKSGQRIYVDDQNNTGGFAVSLGDGGAGRVRFFSRAVSPVIFDSPAVVSSNNWYFVVATHDATLKKRRLIIYDAGGSRLSDTSDVYTGSWGFDAGTAAIGGENLAATENSSGFRFQGRLDETRIYSRVLADTEIAAIYANEVQGLQRDGSLRLCPVCNATLGNFNAFDSSTPGGSATGVIKTKIAGTTFAASSGNIDVVSLIGGVPAPFVGNATVQFLDARDNSGALDAKGCRASWTVITTDAGLAAFTLTFVGQTRLALPAKTPVNAWPEVRVKISNALLPGNYGCSNDAFAIRPAYLDTVGAQARDADWQNPGNGRVLNNLSASGGNVHAAGKSFSLSGLTARNAVTATTTNYAGNPTLVPGNLVLPDPGYCTANGYACVPGSFTVGSWSYASGVLSSSSAAYSEAGAFSWEAEDRSFASVDAADSTRSQRYFRSNAVIYSGRFVPASYQLNLNAPLLQTFGSACATRSFTYLGQPFGYSVTPSVTVRAMNGAATPAQTLDYLGVVGSGGIWKLASPLAYSSAACTAPTQTCAMTRVDAASKTRFIATYTYTPLPATALPGWATLTAGMVGNATLASANNGSGTLAFGATDKLALRRDAAVAPEPTTQAPFNADIKLALQLDDLSEAGPAGNPATISGSLTATAVAFDAGNQFRLGRLRLINAYGSELLPLRVPVQTEFYTGSGWNLNGADSCTAIPLNALVTSNVTGPAPVLAVATPNPLVMNQGKATLIFNAPGTAGRFDLAADLNAAGADTSCNAAHGGAAANMPWLQGFWSANCNGTPAWAQDPNARIRAGSPKSPYIYLRERY